MSDDYINKVYQPTGEEIIRGGVSSLENAIRLGNFSTPEESTPPVPPVVPQQPTKPDQNNS